MSMLMRSAVGIPVLQGGEDVNQKECAARMGVTQPRLSDLLKGKINKFSLDALVNMLGHAGMRVRLTVKKAA